MGWCGSTKTEVARNIYLPSNGRAFTPRSKVCFPGLVVGELKANLRNQA